LKRSPNPFFSQRAWLCCFFGVSRTNMYYLSTKSFCFLEAPVFVSTAVPISTREGHVEPRAFHDPLLHILVSWLNSTNQRHLWFGMIMEPNIYNTRW
jgi:hypothetical protein